jgi:hypothetical protein
MDELWSSRHLGGSGNVHGQVLARPNIKRLSGRLVPDMFNIASRRRAAASQPSAAYFHARLALAPFFAGFLSPSLGVSEP